MVSTKDKKFRTILKLFKKVEESGLSANAYFATHTTPIGVVQYFRLKKRFEQQGEIGLLDQRHSGNARKLTEEQIQLMQGIFTYNRQLSSGSLQNELLRKWGIQLHRSHINQLRNQLNLPRLLPEMTRQETVQLAGIEIFAALAHHVGILDHWNTTIQQRLEQVKQTEQYGDGLGTGDHIDARRRDGKFLSRYNRLSDVREMKFASINDKIKTKDFSRLTVYQRKRCCIHGKASERTDKIECA